MTTKQIMKLVDEYADERIMATKGRSDGVDVALARAAVVDAVSALTKDAERLDHIQVTGSTVELVNFGQKPVQHSFRVGGLYKAINFDLRLAIDAAIAASKEQV